MVQPAPATLTTVRCNRPKCGGNIIFEDGDAYCWLCGRPYQDWADFGRMGGLQTSLRYGREHMAEIGKRGGLASRLPTIAEVRQQSAPQAQIQIREERLPNRLSELKELWKLRNNNGGSQTVGEG